MVRAPARSWPGSFPHDAQADSTDVTRRTVVPEPVRPRDRATRGHPRVRTSS